MAGLMSQRHGSRHPQLGLGGSPCSVLGQQEEAVSSSQLQVLGLTDSPTPHYSLPKSCLGSFPWQEALRCSSVVRQPSPATPPALSTKALQAEQPHCPRAGLPSETLPTLHLPGSPGSCCCLPQPMWLHS